MIGSKYEPPSTPPTRSNISSVADSARAVAWPRERLLPQVESDDLPFLLSHLFKPADRPGQKPRGLKPLLPIERGAALVFEAGASGADGAQDFVDARLVGAHRLNFPSLRRNLPNVRARSSS